MDANASHFSPEMMQGQMMFQHPGMSSPGQMPQMPYGNMEQLQNQVGHQMAQGQAAHPGYAMQGHAMGMQAMGQGMPQGMPQNMQQGMPQQMPQGMAQGGAQMPQGMSDGSMAQYMDQAAQAQAAQAQAAQAQQHQMMQHGAGGCPCQGNPCGACAGGCGGNCGGYVFQPMQGMMMPQNMVQGQMPMGAQQQAGADGQHGGCAQGQQFHPNMQFVMVPGAGGHMGHMQQGMAGMQQMQGQMAQMQGMQGQMPHMPGHMADGHGNPAQSPGDHGQGAQAGDAHGDGDAKGGPGRMAAGRRNTQPKQGASWQGNRPGRPADMRSPEEGPAVPGEQGKGAQADGQKGMRKPKNPWADIQDSGGLDPDMAQMWAIGQTDNQQKSSFGKGKSKKDGKDGKGDDGPGKGKDAPQQKWVEVQKNNNNNVGKGQRGMRQDQWQPKESPKLQEAVPMSPMPTPGKGKAQPVYNPGVAPVASAKKKGGRRDPKMDDWLSARFGGQVPTTPTGSFGFGGDESEWAGGDGYEDSDRPKRKGAGGKAGGKGGKKGGGGSPKGKSKGRANGGNYWRGS